MKKIELIVEKGDDKHLWGRIEGKEFMPTGQGKNISALIQNIKEGIADYVQHEGTDDKYWLKLDMDEVVFEIKYDLETFFEHFDELNISAIATRAGLNQSLLRQYKTGEKHPSIEQVKKIEKAIHELGKELTKVNLMVA